MSTSVSTITLYHRRADLVTAGLGSGVAVLDLPSSSYLGFNPTAASVWDLLEAPRSLDQIVEALILKYNISPQQCREDVNALLLRLVADRLILPVEQSVA